MVSNQVRLKRQDGDITKVQGTLKKSVYLHWNKGGEIVALQLIHLITSFKRTFPLEDPPESGG